MPAAEDRQANLGAVAGAVDGLWGYPGAGGCFGAVMDLSGCLKHSASGQRIAIDVPKRSIVH